MVNSIVFIMFMTCPSFDKTVGIPPKFLIISSLNIPRFYPTVGVYVRDSVVGTVWILTVYWSRSVEVGPVPIQLFA